MSDKTYIKVNLPKDLKQNFKLICTAEGVTITSKLIAYMQKEINSNQNIIDEVNKAK